MKSLLKIIRRYCLMAGLIIFIILSCNVGVLIGITYAAKGGVKEQVYGRDCMELTGGELFHGENGVMLSKKGQEILDGTDFVWAMALDGEGRAVWEWRLPDEIPRSYTLQEVSGFSRWYLKDYPVRTWKSGEWLLVFGCDKEKIVRYDMIMSIEMVRLLPVYMKAIVFVNLAMIVLFIVTFGFRFYQSMKPVVEGIEKLSLGAATNVSENGSMEEVAKEVNLVSKKLKEQQKALAKRDEARTEWIAGVSHDIRTPLSLIVGYSDKLAEDESLSKDNRTIAENMKKQSLIIRQLITDLNLTSKLAYQAQPLKKQICSPAAILRDCVAEVYNGQIEQEAGGENDESDFIADHTIEIVVKKEAESERITADTGLIRRALRNLMGNSFRHNKDGCHVTVTLSVRKDRVCWRVEDTGCGIPEIIVQNMDRTDSAVHIMGLRLVSQIARAHGGELIFIRRESGRYDVEFLVERKV